MKKGQKKARPAWLGAALSVPSRYLATGGVAFGSLERIELGAVAVLFLFLFHVRGQIAESLPPLGLGIRKGAAVAGFFPIEDAVATLTIFHDSMAFAAVERTAFFAHESTINTLFYACAVHRRNPPAWVKIKESSESYIYIKYFI
jgi:hypothetical protein